MTTSRMCPSLVAGVSFTGGVSFMSGGLLVPPQAATVPARRTSVAIPWSLPGMRPANQPPGGRTIGERTLRLGRQTSAPLEHRLERRHALAPERLHPLGLLGVGEPDVLE